MLSKAVNARLPLMLAGRPLPGHGDDQVGTGCNRELARKGPVETTGTYLH